MSTLTFKKTNPEIGLNTRKSKTGPEKQLVDDFLNCYTEETNEPFAIFWEPSLDTGYPDIVIASFQPKVFEEWSKHRFELSISDIKMLHYLYSQGGATSEDIERALGVDKRNLLKSIERLLDSKMIRRYSKKWMPYSIKRRYAIDKIVAIEAKIKDWKSAFEQAQNNKWFASESFVLSPNTSPTKRIIERSQELGVGILSFKKSKIGLIEHSQKSSLPSSYASWLFNEWIGRRLNL